MTVAMSYIFWLQEYHLVRAQRKVTRFYFFFRGGSVSLLDQSRMSGRQRDEGQDAWHTPTDLSCP